MNFDRAAILVGIFLGQSVFAQEEQSDWGFGASVGSSSEGQATLGMRFEVAYPNINSGEDFEGYE